MKRLVFLFIATAYCSIGCGQQLLKTGDYGYGLKLAYDSQSKKLSGYFEMYTGMDEETKKPKFSCIFYLEGTYIGGKKMGIKTYYPDDLSEDLIVGTLEIANDASIILTLPEEHGGCWNVQPFAREPVAFDLEKSYAWQRISYIKTDKAYFYSDKSTDKKKKSYVVKNDFVCIEKTEGDWVYCTYFGDKTTKGWIKLSDVF